MKQTTTTSVEQAARRAFLIGAVATTATGCMGSFGLSRSVYGWNSKLGGKMVNGIVFMLLFFTTIYGILMAIDVFLLNVLEFWFDTKLITAANTDENGTEVASTRVKGNLVRHEVRQDGKTVQVLHSQLSDDGRLTLLDGEHHVIATVEPAADGAVARDGRGRIVARLSAEQLQQLRRKVETSPSPQAAIVAMNNLREHGLESRQDWAAIPPASAAF